LVGGVADTFLLGAVAQVSLLLSGLFATWVTVPSRIVGWLGAFGAGALISAVAFDLTRQAIVLGGLGLMLSLLAGAGVFILGDYAVDRQIGPGGPETGAIGIVLGAVVDGVPESLTLGISLAAAQGVSASFLAAVVISNIPQALAPSAELAATGWSRARLTLMWGTVVITCGLASALGFVLGEQGGTGARFAGLAAGGVLSMLTNSLMPFSVERGGRLAGLWTVVGFALAILPR
jgi:ZIP family zinc transporter